MNYAETEGTDIKNSAETEGTDIQNMAETEGTDSDSCIKLRGKKILNLMLIISSLLISQLAVSSDLKLFTTDNQNYKGVIQHKGQISFVEGYVEADKGYFMLNTSLENSIKATDEGTGGDKATDEGTGGDKATDEGTGGDKATDEGTGGDKATDEGTGGDKATDEGTGGDKATDEGTGNSINSGLITVNFGCDNQKSMAVFESNKYSEKMQINTIQINGQLKKCK
ncbi:hypothetical protein MNBD_GAMMA02-429 [hydrothermal vent metagenome]|uniref:Uncharacterized protein n=1 Tax=hydrothermal vent metagenome TaxID=652676 RepID=A0A3B0VZ84_9ZZZZ